MNTSRFTDLRCMRCINCAIRISGEEGIGYRTIRNISVYFLIKLRKWLNPSHVVLRNFICNHCHDSLKGADSRGPLNTLICMGCGASLAGISSHIVDKEQLATCKSWVPGHIPISHLNRVCMPCHNRLLNEIEDANGGLYAEYVMLKDPIATSEVKSEPEDVDIEGFDRNYNKDGNHENNKHIDDYHDENCELDNENEQRNVDNLYEENNKSDEDNDGAEDISEEECVFIKQENGDCINYEFLDENEYSQMENGHTDTESRKARSETRSENEKNIDYDFLNEHAYAQRGNGHSKADSHKEYLENTESDNESEESMDSELTKENRRSQAESRKARLENRKALIEGRQSRAANREARLVTQNAQLVTITLNEYTRTTRIGRCIFKKCKNDCVSLIPSIVRRRMLIEHNLYIPLLSKVCKTHLRDQNWEYLTANSSREFPAHYCEDMFAILDRNCKTDFDFENIEHVNSRLVRYWFNVNKVEFNRIFGNFPTLKRLKYPKTAFALYLMFLQNKSFSRISLLLKMNKLKVQKSIEWVMRVVKCDTFKQLKRKYIDIDDDD